MHYEITNIIDENNPAWTEQKKRIQETNGKVFTLAPDPGLRDELLNNQIQGLNLIDTITHRSIDYDKSAFMYFNRVPTVDGAEIFMNEDFSVDIIANGDVIGHVILWPLLRRHVKEIQYIHQNRQPDYTEEIASDGKKFSNIIYTRDDVQRIDFYDDNEHPVVRFFFYQNNLNWITISDFHSLNVVAQYSSMDDFVATEVGKLLTENDTVGINFLGIELTALSKSKSQNTLYLAEDPIDENGNVRGNLMAILNNDISYVQRVRMSEDKLQKLINAGAPTSKVEVDAAVEATQKD
ncbi:hypothetical protein ACFQ22_01535 [Lentilactobacillus raoultii]|uniref:DUF4868 domain-containing protein n=1 Tax=Lentilactobacillus raoultii TaxID=1987503 RepID=A0ABW3PH34_9LACO|nr:hypothetical protein [Lentilactobacillus raoultii]